MERPRASRILSRLATLAAVASPARAGANLPGAAAPLAGAPPFFAAGARATTRVDRLRRSLRACTAEGLFAELINACAGGAVLTAWAIHLGAGPLYAGVLVALPQIAQLFHLPAAWTTHLFGHRRACLWLVGASRQVLLPLALVPFLPVGDPHKRALLLVVAGLSAVLGVLGNNAWVAWMGELVPRRIRGRYFGRRSGLCMLGGALAATGAGALLDWARPRGHAAAVLAVLQVLACAAGLCTTWLMGRQHDPAAPTRAVPLRPAAALAPLGDGRVRALLLYQLAWNLAVGLAGSFFALHMLQNLRMGFTLVALHGTATAAVRMVAAPLWGPLIDRLGARPVLVACSFGIAVIPFVWLLPTEARLWPLLFDAVLAGLLWSGHGLAMFALPLAVTSRRERPFYLAVFSAGGGLAFCAATAVGGALATWLPATVTVAGSTLFSLQILFVLSGSLRLGAALVSLRIHEPAARGLPELWAAITRGVAPAPPTAAVESTATRRSAGAAK